MSVLDELQDESPAQGTTLSHWTPPPFPQFDLMAYNNPWGNVNFEGISS